MPDSIANLVALLHLGDSSLPTGGFAFSGGLESSAKLGLLGRYEDLESYFRAVIEQAGEGELPYLQAAWELAAPPPGADLAEVAAYYDAFLAVPTLHHASVVQGRTCLRLFGALHPDVPCEDLRAWFAAHELPPHLVLVLGLTLGRAHYSLPAAATLFLYTTVRDQLSAAIRLGLLGPTDAHTLLASLYPAMATARAAAAARPWRAATRRYPLLELAQASHPYVYAKLFQS